MRFAVLGAGAIGAYVGAALARGGAEVHLIARGDNLEALRRDGVQVRSDRGDFEAHPPATDDSNEVGPVDFVFLGLKANSYAGCEPLLEPLLHEETAVVAGTELAEPGIVEHLEGTRFSIGEPDGSISERCRQFSEAMVAGGLKCPVEERLRDEIWVKLMGNVAFNPLSVLTRATLAEMCSHAPARALVTSIMEETLEIADAVGAEPSVSIEQRLEGAEKVGDHKPSTLQDLEAGKPLELAAIVDSVVELADLTRVPAPTLGAVSAASGLLAETLGLR